jgi:glucose-1-phosphate adenylyltransferase
MDILGQRRPKPALPFAGNFRVIDFTLSNCIHSEINNIAVLVDYRRSDLSSYLKQLGFLKTCCGTFHVLEPKARSYKGTADAVYQNLGYLHQHNADTILILAADHVYKMDYRKMLAFHEWVVADVTVGVISVPIEQAHRFGILTVNTEDRITEFIEKPRFPASDLASMGLYIFNREVLEERLTEDAADDSSSHDFGHDVIPSMVKRDKVFAYRYRNYWQDIGTLEAYYQANMEVVSELAPFSLDGGWPVLTKGTNLPPPAILPPGIVSRSIVSPGCLIRGEVTSSILSPGVTVEERAIVRNSVIMANSIVGEHSVIDRCVLDEEVNVGKFCYLGLGTSLISGNWDITVVGRSVTVPPFTAVGRNCKILPNVGAGDFTTNVVSMGSVVSPRLP